MRSPLIPSLAATLCPTLEPLTVNCGFSTLAQCQASSIGGGDQCFQNPVYVPSRSAAGPRKEQKHKSAATKQ
jgi:hypothetical protein